MFLETCEYSDSTCAHPVYTRGHVQLAKYNSGWDTCALIVNVNCSHLSSFHHCRPLVPIEGECCIQKVSEASAPNYWQYVQQ